MVQYLSQYKAIKLNERLLRIMIWVLIVSFFFPLSRLSIKTYSIAITQFHGFFNFGDMEPIMDSFCVYHINAPGQEPNAEQIPIEYDELIVILWNKKKIF
jgi:hypothetical protein